MPQLSIWFSATESRTGLPSSSCCLREWTSWWPVRRSIRVLSCICRPVSYAAPSRLKSLIDCNPKRSLACSLHFRGMQPTPVFRFQTTRLNWNPPVKIECRRLVAIAVLVTSSHRLASHANDCHERSAIPTRRGWRNALVLFVATGGDLCPLHWRRDIWHTGPYRFLCLKLWIPDSRRLDSGGYDCCLGPSFANRSRQEPWR